MPVQLYLDVHVDKAIHDQLRLRGVDVLRAQDDDAAELTDEELLQRAADLNRVFSPRIFASRRLPRTGNALESHLLDWRLGIS